MNILLVLFIILITFTLCVPNKTENYYDVFGQYIEAPFKETANDNMETLADSFYPEFNIYYYPYPYRFHRKYGSALPPYRYDMW